MTNNLAPIPTLPLVPSYGPSLDPGHFQPHSLFALSHSFSVCEQRGWTHYITPFLNFELVFKVKVGKVQPYIFKVFPGGVMMWCGLPFNENLIVQTIPCVQVSHPFNCFRFQWHLDVFLEFPRQDQYCRSLPYGLSQLRHMKTGWILVVSGNCNL